MTTKKLLLGIASLATCWLGLATLSTTVADLQVAKVDPRVSFKKDAQGKVTGLVLHPRGEREAKKIR
jgi:hypothetical protein